MTTIFQNYIPYVWNFFFNHEVSPVRNIPDIATRHYVLQALGFIWAITFSTMIGSYTVFAYSVIGHAFLFAAIAITVVTLTTASSRPKLFIRGSGRRYDGEHL